MYGLKPVPFKESDGQGARKKLFNELVCAVALLDVSTGEFRTAEFQGAKAR